MSLHLRQSVAPLYGDVRKRAMRRLGHFRSFTPFCDGVVVRYAFGRLTAAVGTLNVVPVVED